MKETCQALRIRRKPFPKSTVQNGAALPETTNGHINTLSSLHRDTGRGGNGEQGWNFPAAVVDTGAYTSASITKVE